MATEGLIALLCAGALIAGDPTAPTPANPPEQRDSVVQDTLAVQTALQQAKELLMRQQFRAAVYVLEKELPRINGSRAFLNALQEAYRGSIKELRLAKKDAEADKYLERLRILDPGALLDQTLAVSAAPAPASPLAAQAPAKSNPVFRGVKAESEGDPFRGEQRDLRTGGDARAILAKAEKEFSNRRYSEARLLYQQANLADSSTTALCKERWAYCRLHGVVEQINQTAPGSAQWRQLEEEVRQALEFPHLSEFATQLLGEMQKRGTPAPANNTALFRHQDRGADGWAITETINYRIFHAQTREYAEQVGRIAERTRAEMGRRWFGSPGEDWNPKCELYLHATGADYQRVTGVPSTSPGHSEIKSEGGRVIGRKIFLHCDDPNLLPAVLPHEATHVVLAGQFGDQQVPRWADEGIAVLSEPREKVERHLRNLARCRQEGQVFQLRQLMQLNDYPDPRYIGAFYAQSVSLVDFLANERGPQVLTQFLRDGLRGGYDAALQRHYGMQSFDELEQRWATAASRGPVSSTAIAGR